MGYYPGIFAEPIIDIMSTTLDQTGPIGRGGELGGWSKPPLPGVGRPGGRPAGWVLVGAGYDVVDKTVGRR